MLMILGLGVLALGFLAILTAAIFGRWKTLAALLVCGTFGMIAVALLSLLSFRVARHDKQVAAATAQQAAYERSLHARVSIERQTP
ncbi:MAG: hypothetical protein ACIALR_11525, partial [Blastopirellula sp. JB062]